MKTIIQLSDLHFGRTNPVIVESLREFILAAKPNVVVVSGDLTQRAKKQEFSQAQEFLSAFDCTKIIVPGNHDVPLYNLWARFKNPDRHFKKFIDPLLEPFYIDQEMAIIGLNTSRSLVWKSGRVNANQLEHVKQKLQQLDSRLVKIIVTHHPLQSLRNKNILRDFLLAGANIFLSGHLHKGLTEDFEHTVKEKTHKALLVQAGTATSVRYRGELNSFNVLLVDCGKITVNQYRWQTSDKKFIKTNSKMTLFPP